MRRVDQYKLAYDSCLQSAKRGGSCAGVMFWDLTHKVESFASYSLRHAFNSKRPSLALMAALCQLFLYIYISLSLSLYVLVPYL